jgi:5-methylcytosine-specific restriction endonuclease McrA
MSPCKICGAPRNTRDPRYRFCDEHYAEYSRVNSNKYYHKTREEITSLLGGKCCRCGFSDPRALQIDHIDGGGKRHRAEHSNARMVYKDMLTHPEDFQLLCANCNQIKKIENGGL